ncbi:MAG: DUF4304 domain-containing protein [Tabrizicola sp.]|nr:DUF4304 domain-containing protein [Tabrizicola sp.]
MTVDRETMVGVLKNVAVPALRKQGFKGSFPSFFRETGKFVALINFQFHSSGGSFCVNLGYADPGRNNVYFQPDTEPAKLKISQTRHQVRLGATDGGDHWFHFGATSYGEIRGEPVPAEEIAARFNEMLITDAERWWKRQQDANSP